MTFNSPLVQQTNELYNTLQQSRATRHAMIVNQHHQKLNIIKDILEAQSQFLKEYFYNAAHSSRNRPFPNDTPDTETLQKLERDTHTLLQKQAEYKERLKEIEETLTNNTTYTDIRNQFNNLLQLSKDVEEAENTLKAFQILSPDLALARIQVQEKKLELSRMKNSKT